MKLHTRIRKYFDFRKIRCGHDITIRTYPETEVYGWQYCPKCKVDFCVKCHYRFWHWDDGEGIIDIHTCVNINCSNCPQSQKRICHICCAICFRYEDCWRCKQEFEKLPKNKPETMSTIEKVQELKILLYFIHPTIEFDANGLVERIGQLLGRKMRSSIELLPGNARFLYEEIIGKEISLQDKFRNIAPQIEYQEVNINNL